MASLTHRITDHLMPRLPLLPKGHKIIHGKVPDHSDTHAYELGDVEIKLHAVCEDIDKCTGDPQPGGHDTGKFKGLHGDIIVLDTPGPPAVQDKIVSGGNDKGRCIGHIFIGLDLFFKKIGAAKIKQEGRETYHYEFAYFLYKGWVYGHTWVIKELIKILACVRLSESPQIQGGI